MRKSTGSSQHHGLSYCIHVALSGIVVWRCGFSVYVQQRHLPVAKPQMKSVGSLYGGLLVAIMLHTEKTEENGAVARP